MYLHLCYTFVIGHILSIGHLIDIHCILLIRIFAMDMGDDDIAAMFSRMMGVKTDQQMQRGRDWANSPINFKNQQRRMNDAEATIQTPIDPNRSLKNTRDKIVGNLESGIPKSTNDNIPLKSSDSSVGNMLSGALQSAGSGLLKGGSFGLGSGLAYAGISGATSLISNALSSGEKHAAEQKARENAAQQTIQQNRNQLSNKQFF